MIPIDLGAFREKNEKINVMLRLKMLPIHTTSIGVHKSKETNKN